MNRPRPELAPHAVAARLAAQRPRFLAFLTSLVGKADDAEDLLQTALLKAFRHAASLRDDEKLVSWFYRLLRRVAIDHVRARAAVRQRETRWALDPALADPSPEAESQLCGCVGSMLEQLPARHRDLLRQVELGDRPVREAAAALRLSPNLASVTLRRARLGLRARLRERCGACADTACLDCSCAGVSAG